MNRWHSYGFSFRLHRHDRNYTYFWILWRMHLPRRYFICVSWSWRHDCFLASGAAVHPAALLWQAPPGGSRSKPDRVVASLLPSEVVLPHWRCRCRAGPPPSLFLLLGQCPPTCHPLRPGGHLCVHLVLFTLSESQCRLPLLGALIHPGGGGSLRKTHSPIPGSAKVVVMETQGWGPLCERVIPNTGKCQGKSVTSAGETQRKCLTLLGKVSWRNYRRSWVGNENNI